MINIHETSDIHGRNTRYSSDFHYPTSNLAVYHHYMGLKVFNSLPPHIKDKLQNIKVFKQLIRNFLDCNTFYTLDKYFNYNKKKILGRFWPYPTLCLSQKSYASVHNHYFHCSIVFMCIITLLFYSIWCWCIWTQALGYAYRGNCVYWTNSISHDALIVPSEDCRSMK